VERSRHRIVLLFTSDNIWFDPEPIIHEKGITSLPVYIDPENPKNYFVSVKDIEMFVAKSETSLIWRTILNFSLRIYISG